MLEKVKSMLNRLLIVLSVWYTFYKNELNSHSKENIFKRIPLISKGFYSKRLSGYDFKKWKYSDYISDMEVVKFSYVNHPYSKLLRNKLVFSNYFRNYFKTPQVYYLINNSVIKSMSPQLRAENFEGFIKTLLENHKVIIKPNLGARGIGIYLVELEEEKYLINKKEVTESELQKFVSSLNGFIVVEFIEQSDFSKGLFPLSTNTLRIDTFFDPIRNKVITKQPYVRIGTSGSVPVDNNSRGGLFSMVDLESGTLGVAIVPDTSGTARQVINHPETNAKIKGEIVPRWTEIKECVLDTSRVISPLIKVVGWDIVITEDDFVVIEGNNGPSQGQQWLDNPLAKDEDMSLFLKHSKIR